MHSIELEFRTLEVDLKIIDHSAKIENEPGIPRNFGTALFAVSSAKDDAEITNAVGN